MDKNTNVHTKVGTTFVSVYYNALAEGKIADVTKMYLPNAKANHFNVEGSTAALAAYAKGARFNISSVETTLVPNDNTRVKVVVKGSVTITGDKKKDFQHDIDLFHHGTNASQFSIGVTNDFMRASAVPPPPKMKFDDWAADTPQLAAQQEAEADVPTIDLIPSKDATPQVTPKVAPKAATPAEEKKVEEKPAAAAPAPVPAPAAEEKKAPVKEEKKAEEEKPAAPKGWASIVRADKTAAKAVISVIDPTKKVEKKEEKVEEKREEKEEKKEKKSERKSERKAAPKTEGAEEEANKGEEKEKGEKSEKSEKSEKKNERRSNKGAGPIFYDVFIKGFPEGTTDADIRTALVTKIAIANTKIDTKEDKSGVKRVFVYVKLSAEDLAKQSTTREEAIAAIVTANKNAKHNGARLSVEEVKERFNADGVSTKAAAKK